MWNYVYFLIGLLNINENEMTGIETHINEKFR